MNLIFDMGGTKTRIALVSRGELGEVFRMDTDRSAAGCAKFLGALEEVARGNKIKAVAGGFPGQVHGKEGEITYAGHLQEWLGLPLVQRIQDLFDCPVDISNDVVLGGLGEAHYGGGITQGVMAYFTVSTGVNAARFVDGQVDESIRPYEIGQQLIPDRGGKVVTLESLTGGAAFERRRGISPVKVRDRAVWREEERHLAYGVYNTALHWAPELVLFGGSMMRDIDLEAVMNELEKLPKVLPALPRLARAKLTDTAGLHGAMVRLERMN